MFQCSFALNNQPMSKVVIGATSFPAFSGLGAHANKRSFACSPNIGPIPPGKYYIIDRQSGGLFGPLRDVFTGRGDWFALYADDSKINDETFCNAVKRGSFRLHPKGALGRSEGCIVVDNPTDFFRLRSLLRSSAQIQIPGAKFKAYGTLRVA